MFFVYPAELLSEDAILEWISNRRNNTENSNPLKLQLFSEPKVQDFIDWIADSDSGSDSGSNSDASGSGSDDE